MTLDLDLQNPGGLSEVPAESAFRRWVEAALAGRAGDFSLSVRVVDKDESRQLNARYRQQDKPTNVLSFAVELPGEVLEQLPVCPLGDLVICAPLVRSEAQAQGKTALSHWAHLTVHGVLHLLGHDHQEQEQAQAMEALEVRILAGLGVPDPYTDVGNRTDSAEIAS